MTKPKPMTEMERPRRVLGDAIRMYLSCPLCREQDDMLRVVAYQRRTVRIECPKCELRFSIDLTRFASALMDKPDVVLDGHREEWMFAAAKLGYEDEDEAREYFRKMVKETGKEALESHARALRTWDAFVGERGTD